MLNRSTTWAVAFLVATFRGGARRRGRRPGALGPVRVCGGARARARPRSDDDELNEELRLDPAQRDSVRAIVQRHRTRMTAVWETVRPRFDSMRAQMDSEVARQLTPEQQAKYRDHVTPVPASKRSRRRRHGDSKEVIGARAGVIVALVSALSATRVARSSRSSRSRSRRRCAVRWTRSRP